MQWGHSNVWLLCNDCKWRFNILFLGTTGRHNKKTYCYASTNQIENMCLSVQKYSVVTSNSLFSSLNNPGVRLSKSKNLQVCYLLKKSDSTISWSLILNFLSRYPSLMVHWHMRSPISAAWRRNKTKPRSCVVSGRDDHVLILMKKSCQHLRS